MLILVSSPKAKPEEINYLCLSLSISITAQTTCYQADTNAQGKTFGPISRQNLYYNAKSSESYSDKVLHYLFVPTTPIRGSEDPDFGFNGLQNAYIIATGT